MKDKKVTGKSQHNFTNSKLFVFYDEITWSMMEGSALDVVYHNFSKAYSADSHILVDILVRYE